MSDLPPPPPRLPGAPPPVPPPLHQTPEPPPAPPSPPSPPRPRIPGPFIVLVALLAVSLLASAMLAARVAEVTADAAIDRARADALRTEVERLRALEAARGSSSPGAVGTGQIGEIAGAVARLRGLSFRSAVTPEIVSTEELRRRVENDFDKEQSREEINRTDRILTTLGLLAPDDDLYGILRGVHSEQIAGFYDSERKKLVVTGTPENLSPFERVLMAHELVHALTDQHFNLSRLDALQDQGKDDEAAAFLALVEGDATLMMFLYRDRILTPDEQREMAQDAGGQSSPLLDAAPAVVRNSLIFPYDQGTSFVNNLYRSGGTEAIDAAYRNPPTSTEQILHPQRFVNRDPPEAVRMPNIAAAAGAGWTALEEGPAGEFDLELIADQFLPDADARAAASGWDGGAYAAVGSGAQTMVATSFVWDSPDEAREAAEALTEWLRPRFAGRGSAYREGPVAGWSSPDGAGEVARSGKAVILIVGPDRSVVERARRSFPAFA